MKLLKNFIGVTFCLLAITFIGVAIKTLFTVNLLNY